MKKLINYLEIITTIIVKYLKLAYQVTVYGSTILLVITLPLVIFKLNLTEFGQLTAQIGTVLLYILVISKSLYFILKQFKLKRSNPIMKVLGENNKYQREMGLIIFNFLFIHGLIETKIYINNFNVLIFEYLTALIPTIILIYLEFTSFKFSQKMIKTWKKPIVLCGLRYHLSCYM